MSSIFTAPGTNAAEADRKQKSNPQRFAGAALSTLNPTLQSQATFANRIEPFRQQSAWDTIHASTPGGVQSTVDNYRRGVLSNNLANLPQLQQILSMGGAGIGAMQGAGVHAINDANSQGNNMLAYYSSPQGRAALAQMAQMAIAQSQSLPSLSGFGNLASIIYGRPAPPVGPSPLATIAGIGAQLYGAGAFGGMGGAGQTVHMGGVGY
jgi:hypothetical protein